MDEYDEVHATHDIPVAKIKKNKQRKKTIYFTQEHFQNLYNVEKSI